MAKAPIEAEYIAEERILKLAEPLSGIEDQAKVEVDVRVISDANQPWLQLAGSLGEDEGRALARAVREAFGRTEIEV